MNIRKEDIVAKIVTGRGNKSKSCLLDFNIDIETGWCSVMLDNAGCPILNSNGNPDKALTCTYCYSKPNQRTQTEPHRIKIISEEEFNKIIKYSPKILRIGKSFECGHIILRPNLYKVLEICANRNIRPIVVSKLLEYDPKIVELVIKSRGAIQISLGRDDLEVGACRYGATNLNRLQVAVQYKNAGCFAQVRIVTDVTLPMTLEHKHIFNIMGSTGILLTPIIHPGKERLAEHRTDVNWEEAKKCGDYVQAKHGKNLYANKLHEDWNMCTQRCGQIGNDYYCNNCVGKIDFDKKIYKAKLIELGWNSPESAE